MNDEINESFIFSIEETEKYLQKPFLTKLYNYYKQNGYFNIISNQVINILISIFLVVYSLFIVNCIEWKKITHLNEETHINEVINMDNLFKLNFFMLLIFMMYIIIIACKLVSLCYDFTNYNEVIYLLNLLNIKDKQLYRISWEEIISRLGCYVNDVDVYSINNKICMRDNYFVTIIDKNIININFLCELMEWNIMYCFINSIFNNNLKFKKEFILSDPKFVENVKFKTKCVAIANFIFMPFIITYLMFYNILLYGEHFYNKPQLLGSRGWSRFAKWKFKNYNELNHEFHEKMMKSQDTAIEYSDQFPSRILAAVSKLCIFVFSSFFVTLVGLSILNQQLLVILFVTKSKSILWFLGIFASIITILKTSIKQKTKYYPEEKMIELRHIINSIPEHWIKEDKERTFFKYFELQIVLLVKEIWYTIWVPFMLFKFSYDSSKIISKLQKITITTAKYGNVNKFALFELDNINDRKTKESIDMFIVNNPNWTY